MALLYNMSFDKSTTRPKINDSNKIENIYIHESL